MKSTLAIIGLVLVPLLLLGCSGSATWGALKRLMYEEPGRDRWQKPDEVVAALGLEPGERVADLGAGGGYFSFRLAKAVGPSGRVYAVDVDDSLLAYVASQAKKRDLPQIETVLAPPDGPGLPAASVDLIFLSNVFHHLPDPVRYFRDARPVLRENGRVAVVEVSEGGFPKGHSTPPEVIRADFEAAGYVLVEELSFLERQSFQVFAPRTDHASD